MLVEAVEPTGGVLERGAGADHRVDVDLAARKERDAGWIFAGTGAGALEADLAGDDGLQRKLDLGGDVADLGHGAAFADRGDGGLDRVGCAYGF